ncbi:MAG: ATP-binding protein [Pseudomonadales bacterium]
MRIYWKIFIAFWLASFLLVSSAMVVGYLVGPPDRKPPPPMKDIFRGLHEHLAAGDLNRLSDWLDNNPRLRGIDLYVMDSKKVIIYPTTAVQPRIKKLFKEARKSRGSLHRYDGDYTHRKLKRGFEQPYEMLLRTPSPWQRKLQENLWLRFVLGLLISGVVCYFLAGLLTRPMRQLSQTVSQLADGDLSARVDIPTSRWQKDEVTELSSDFNHMADHLERLLKSQKQLLGDVSHELRSPLARIQIALELVRQRQGESSELDRIAKELQRLEEIIADLLLLPKLESSGELLNDTVDLIGLVNAIVEDCRLEASSLGCTLSWQESESELLVRGNVSLLRSAVENIIRNAMRYTPAQSSVDIQLSVDERGILLTVRDYGPGLSQEHIDHIFEPFYQADSARGHESGVGLGLAITDRAIRAHGGSVQALNRTPGLEMALRLPSRLQVFL